MARGSSSFGQYADQAARDALLHFGPRRQNLSDLIRAAREQYGSRVTAARAGATATKAAINHAIPEIRQIYGGADQASRTGATLLAAALQGAPADSPFRQGMATESNAALNALAGERSTREANLETQKTAAVGGAQQAQVSAQQVLAHELSQLLSKGGAISAEEGEFAHSEADKLAREAAKEEATERRAQRKEAGTERRARRKEANSGGGTGGQLSPEKQNSASSALRGIERYARALREQEHLSPKQILEELTTDHGGKTFNRPKKDAQGRELLNAKKEPEYEQVKTPVIKAHDVLLSEAAIEAVFGGGRVSKAMARKLHQAGYSVRKLGLQFGGRPARQQAAEGVTGGVNAGR